MTLFAKIKWVLGIMLIFLLVLTTNLVDRQNFMVIRDSMETIYADRLVAQDVIYELSRLVWEKKVVYASPEFAKLAQQSQAQNNKLVEAIDRFSATKLTEQEEITFSRLQESLQLLIDREEELKREGFLRSEVLSAISNVQSDLEELSAIQLREGKRQLFAGKKAISSADLFTQLEIGVLIVLAIAIQVIILYTPSVEEARKTQRDD